MICNFNKLNFRTILHRLLQNVTILEFLPPYTAGKNYVQLSRILIYHFNIYSNLESKFFDFHVTLKIENLE